MKSRPVVKPVSAGPALGGWLVAYGAHVPFLAAACQAVGTLLVGAG